MLKIVKTSDNSVMGLTENPVYIRKADNGCYVLCEKSEANGFVFRGEPYHLASTPDLDGLETVAVFSEDSGLIEEITANSITGLEDAICEADAVNAQRMADIEDALCEQDGGNNNG